MFNNVLKLVILFLIVSCQSKKKYQKLELPSIISDHMVLQQDAECVIWGWTDSNKIVSVSIQDKEVYTTADKNGKWQVKLPLLKANGPYEMTIKAGANKKIISDILVGENWLGSGQSNMQWGMNKTDSGEAEIVKANFHNIRLFYVPRVTADKPQKNVEAKWVICTPENVENFSAVLYHFGKKLHQTLNRPLGLILSSWGGTPAEAWTSMEKMEQMPEIDFLKKKMISRSKSNDKDLAYFEKVIKESKSKKSASIKLEEIIGVYDVISGESNEYPGVLTVSMDNGKLNAFFNWQKTTNNVTFKLDELSFNYLSKAFSPDPFTVKLKFIDDTVKGTINDGDGVGEYPINGVKRIDPKKGLNLGRPPYQSYPSHLFNAMLAPLIPFTIKGVIWYQGEANVSRANRYYKLFSNMIIDWREKWNQGDFPFYFVQLAPFNYNGDIDGVESAKLREAQFKTMSLSNTGMAVITDIGNVYDIHPRNKKEVGRRLSLWALAKDYGNKDIVYSGPLYKSMKVEAGKIRLEFDNSGSGLISKGGSLTHFKISGPNKKFITAAAKIDGNSIIVSNKMVPKPIAVRFGFTNGSEPNLFNKEGLPASTFRTDNWE
jgi:sialate O-acetylesterase